MAFNLGDIFVTLKAKGDDLNRGLNTAMSGIKKFGSGVGKFMGAATQASDVFAGALVAMGAAAVVFGKKSVDAYFAAQEAQTKLRTNLLNVKGATEDHVKSLMKQASALQKVGVIEDDVIIAGQSQLATFNLQGKTIEKLTPKITDMVAQLKGHNATSEDMVGINNLVGKVMTGNVGALSRYGVTLDANQKKVLENGNESEKAAMLVEVLGQNYGKVNEELRKTPQGRITGLKNAFGDLQEGVGEFIVQAAAPVIDAFTSWVGAIEDAGGIMEWLKKTIEENQGTVAMIVGAILTALIPALVSLGISLVAATWPLLLLFAAGALIGKLLNDLAQSMGGWGVLWDVVKEKVGGFIGAMQGVWNWIKIIWEVLKPFRDFIGTQLKQAWDDIKKAFNDARTALEPHLPLLKEIAKVIGIVLLVAIAVIVGTFVAMIVIIAKVISWIVKLGSWFLQLQLKMLSWAQTAGRVVGEKILQIINFFRSMPGKISAALGGLKDRIIAPFKSAFDWVIRQVDRVKGALSNLNPGNLIKGIGGKLAGLIPGFAGGVNNFGGGLAVVGEHGPELVNLPGGSDVIPNGKSNQMLKGGPETKIYGDINIASRQDADYLLRKLNHNQELISMGVSPRYV